MDIERVISIARDAGTRVRVRTTVTNRGSEPEVFTVTARTEFSLGRTDDCALVVPSAPGEAQELAFPMDVDSREIILQDEPVKAVKMAHWRPLVAAQPSGPWVLLMHPLRQVGVRQTYDLDGRRSSLPIKWSYGKKRITLELVGPKVMLEPGNSFTYSQSLEVIHDLDDELGNLKLAPLIVSPLRTNR